MAQRKAAAAHLAVRRALTPMVAPRRSLGARANAIAGLPGAAAGALPTRQDLYFSGVYPNYAYSPLPNVADTVNCSAPNFCGIRKFVDAVSLPGQITATKLKQTMPVAVADKTTFPGSDYYEIELVQYTEQLHSDLPATMLRGYTQHNISPAMAPSYLGPLIMAKSGTPVRVKFTNKLGSVTDTNFATTGNLFVPEDKSVLGSGLGLAKSPAAYLDNRATIHMHGGNTPWISDGTPHQWTVPAVDAGTTYPRGDSVQFVPDMFFVNGVVVPQCSLSGAVPPLVTTNCSGPNNATTLPANAVNDPGPGSLTFFYTNQQTARLMFYHDHAYGTTRLNVYIGEAAGYLLSDDYEADLINGSNVTGVNPLLAKAIPSVEIPLVIQDKTFVPPNPVSTTIYSVPMLEYGEGYTAAAVTFTGGCNTEPTANATVGTMTDPFGQFIYGAVMGINLLTYGSGCSSDPVVAITGDGTGAAAFASIATLSQQDPTWDSATWGGTGNLWYPHVYMPNQWPSNPDGSGSNPMGRWDYASWFWPAFTNQYQVRGDLSCPSTYDPNQVCPGVPTALLGDAAPATDLAGGTNLGVGSTASITPEAFMDTPMVNGTVYPVLTVDPEPVRFRVLSVGNDRTLNLSLFLACGVAGNYTPNLNAVCPTPTVAGIQPGTEVGMVPAVPNSTPNYPVWWPTDGRDGGVPDPAAAGPSWYAIGNEGGFLPALAVIPPAPVNYEYSRRSVTVTNTSSVSLNLMPAERADVIVDFTNYGGKTLILYNDAPAPYPAFDTRYDYYTGDPDQTGVGGAPSTLVGFGPNTRTIMQIKVNTSVLGTQTFFNSAALKTLLPAVFAASQPVPVVPEPVYSAAYKTTFTTHYPTLGSNKMTFTPIGATLPTTITYGQKAIQELFELDYGRMNATLGTEIQLTTYNNQTTIPLGYVDPFTDDSYDSANVAAQPVGVAGDGTQIWEVIHNGVDSHAIHFHLFNVQIIDRVGWDGTLRAPLPIEQGWKDTVRMNPLEIDFVALRPMSQTLPFPIPDSLRLLDVTRPAGVDPAMSTFGPTNAGFSQMNSVVPMGWEYVWHCHILGHEENDMMREQVLQVPPQTPVNLAAFGIVGGNKLTFTDMSLSEAGFSVQRADDIAFTKNLTTFTLPAQAGWNVPVSYTDTTAVLGTPYSYRVQTYKPDANYWNTSLGQPPLSDLVSGWSNVPAIQLSPALAVNPAFLVFGSQSYLITSAPLTVNLSNVGSATAILSSFSISGVNAADFAISSNTCPLAAPNLIIGSNCNINVTFNPTYAGTRTATLAISSNDPANPVLSVPITGTGAAIPLKITASSATINWGAAVPTITPIVVGLVGTDTVAGLGTITCTTSYLISSNVGTYPTNCSGASNPAYSISYAAGKVVVKQVPAAMISPTPSSVLAGSNVTFTWNTGGLATRYQLQIGTTGVASSNLYNPGQTAALSAPVTIPTNGMTIYVRLFSFVSGSWQFVDYTYTESGAITLAGITSPAPNTILPAGSPVTFQWSAGNGVTKYQLQIGTTGVASGNLYSPGQTSALSAIVPAIPANGMTVYVRLFSLAGTTWKFVDYTYTETGAVAPATITSPAPGSVLAGTSVTFQWNIGSGVSKYQLVIGTNGVGSGNLYNPGQTSALSANVTGLPATAGVKVYARLYSLIGTTWQFVDTTYTAF